MQSTHEAVEILIIEDNAADVFLISTALRDTRVANTLTCVADGARGLAYLNREGEYSGASRPDLVLLDLKLPRISGHEVLAAMKADVGLRSIPIIVITGSRSANDLTRAYGNGIAAYIVKPGSRDEYFNAIHSLKGLLSHIMRRVPNPPEKDERSEELDSGSYTG